MDATAHIGFRDSRCFAQRSAARRGTGAVDLPERGLYPRVAELRRVTVDGAGSVDLAQATLHIGVAASSMQCAACNMYDTHGMQQGAWARKTLQCTRRICHAVNSEGACECALQCVLPQACFLDGRVRQHFDRLLVDLPRGGDAEELGCTCDVRLEDDVLSQYDE